MSFIGDLVVPTKNYAYKGRPGECLASHTSKIAEWVEILAATPGALNLIPKIYMEEGEKQLQ